MTYREAGDVMVHETWWQRTRAVVRVLRWATAATLGLAALVAACAMLPHACDVVDRCRDSASLLNSAVGVQVACDGRARLEITQVASGQLARCTCVPPR